MAKKIYTDENDVDPTGPTRRGSRHVFGSGEDDLADIDGNAGRATARANDEAEEGDWQTRRARRKLVEDEVDEDLILPVGWLVIVEGPGLGQVATIEAGTNVIGRGKGSHILLDYGDDTISKSDHARIIYLRASRQFSVLPGKGRDTLFKGDDLVDRADLARGDLIKIGRTVLRFVPFCDEAFTWEEPPRA